MNSFNEKLNKDLGEAREKFAVLEKWDNTLETDEAKEIIQSFKDQLANARERYLTIEARNEDAQIELARAQGAESQILNHLSIFHKVKERKKELAIHIESLLGSITDEDNPAKSGRGIISKNIESEDKQ